jgi:prolyl-tRNA editing enzyme YbaK/EbsC (Cys-tRNA(Pro) deacylase)
MTNQLSTKAARVQAALERAHLSTEVKELSESTRTAAEAAAGLSCTVAQIAKSLIFTGVTTGEPILVIASGSNRVNESKMAELIGQPLKKATAEFVLEKTGYAIGGVPPVGHLQPLKTFIDQDLLQYEIIWAAAGTGHAVFSLAPTDLERITGGQVVSVS